MKYPQALLLVLLTILVNTRINAQEMDSAIVYESEELIIEKVSDHVYRHISYLHTESWGKVACNGMLVLSQKEALVADTPASTKGTEELIQWLKSENQSEIKAVIATHFHEDCLAGLPLFHQAGVPSFGHRKTPRLAKKSGGTPPQYGIASYGEFYVGQLTVQVQFLGRGHTRDNLLVYVPGEEVLFGGCLVKSNGAGEGNLADAVVGAWPKTMANTKAVFPDLKIIIPGHGKPGDMELLDYTATLFRKE